LLVTVILVALIICFMVVTVFSLSAMLIVRRREQKYEGAQKLEKAISELDSALDTALKEINKMGGLVQADVDEKYKSMLFLYSLVEEKQKEIGEIEANGVAPRVVAGESQAAQGQAYAHAQSPPQPVITSSDVVTAAEKEMLAVSPAAPPPEPKRPPKFANSKHKQIWEMRESGKAVSDIAREFSMGQGEVKLILEIIDRG